jgi:hypothetical protein
MHPATQRNVSEWVLWSFAKRGVWQIALPGASPPCFSGVAGKGSTSPTLQDASTCSTDFFGPSVFLLFLAQIFPILNFETLAELHDFATIPNLAECFYV